MQKQLVNFRLSHAVTVSFAIAVMILAFGVKPASAVTPMLALGEWQTCALVDDGVVKCFGSNRYGQLGTTTNNNTLNPNPTPAAVPLSAPATQVATGSNHTCALLTDGTVVCFGNNFYGQLGTTTNNNTLNPNPTPASVPLGAPATQIATGSYHTCALLADGMVKCFGHNHRGQLGIATNSGTGNPNPAPTVVVLGGSATQIVAKENHTCVLLVDGSVKCFGDNYYGQLGTATNNYSSNPNPTPAFVPLGASALQISTGGYHSCALLAAGSLKCFGVNDSGQLGTTTNNGNGTANPTPTTAPLGTVATQLSVGVLHTCVLITDGSARCFGRNNYGQLGIAANSGTLAANPIPTAVPLGASATQITAGYLHTCALLTDGSVTCFGDNLHGQLGSEIPGYSYTPSTVVGLNLISPPPVPVPTPTAKSVKLPKPKLKKSIRGQKLKIAAEVVLAGVDAAACRGRIQIEIKRGKKRLIRKSFALRFARGKCSAKVALTTKKRYKRTKVKLTERLVGSSTLTASPRTFSFKL